MDRWLRTVSCRLALAAAIALVPLAGCQDPKPPPRPPRYTELPKKEVPKFMEGTIYEAVDVENTEGFLVSGYGLVGRLRGSGDSTAPTAVRQFMIKEMVKHGWGSKLLPGYEKFQPEDILRDPNYAIVRVDGYLPPGARKGEAFDVSVASLPGNRTSSLSRGVLFETELRRVHDRGPLMGGPGILARSGGPILVNPAYALDVTFDKDGNLVPKSPAARASLRNGLVMHYGRIAEDRPILLRIRQPQRSVARAIEYRINDSFQAIIDRKKANDLPGQAEAQDEGVVELYVPQTYRGDWERFIGLCTHLYIQNSSAFAAAKARELAAEATKPDAPLMDISYCWEGLGEPSLQYTLPLMAHANPDVAFAAARASAMIGDKSGAAVDALMRMAREKSNSFQLTAIKTLGLLPRSTMINVLLRELLDSDVTLARIEAYKILADNADSSIYTRWVPRPGKEEKFGLDFVRSKGPTLVYASRRGKPRIAVIGRSPTLLPPVTFMTMNDKFMIASAENSRNVTLFFRDEWVSPKPLQMMSRPDVAEIVARLGGEGAPQEDKFDFTYGEILAVLQTLDQQKKLCTVDTKGESQLAAFVLEDSPRNEEEILTAPPIPEGRPQTDGETVGLAAPPGGPKVNQ